MRKNYVLFLCICSASLFFSTLGVRAGQVNEDLQMETEVQEQEYNGFHKQMKVTLDNDYSACSFKIEFESEGNYKAELIDTQENSHDFVVIDRKTMTCDLDKTKKGEYTVNIISASEDDIGKVTLSVNSQKTSTTDIVDNNIKIGRDISGLKMYLKDSSLIVTWTDETCGAVNVKVVNPDTGETVKNEKVTTKYFECNLNDDIQKISVSVVPAASSSITGAELTFNIDASYNPDATIKFPDKTKVNKDEITIHAALGNTYSIYAEDNDECVLTTDMMIEGDYDLKIPLKYDGSNKLKVYVLDADGNMKSTAAEIYKDTVAPVLSFDEEYDGIETTNSSFTIAGNVTNYDTFKINDSDVKVATDGHFEKECALHLGENHIKVVAADDAGNETKYEITINEVEKKVQMDPRLIVIIVIVCILIYSKIRKNKLQKETLIKNNLKVENDKPEDDETSQESVLVMNDEDENEDKDENHTDKEEKKFALLKKKIVFKKRLNNKESNENEAEEMQSERTDETEKNKHNFFKKLKVRQKIKKDKVSVPENTVSEVEPEPKGSLENLMSESPKQNEEVKCDHEEKVKNKYCSEDRKVTIITIPDDSMESEKKDNSTEKHQEEGTQTIINVYTNESRKPRKKKGKLGWLIGKIVNLSVFVGMLFIIFHYVLLNGYIRSGSMEPAMVTGDFTISNRLAYTKSLPCTGDIIFFEHDGEIVSKRVIGVAGDAISFADGKVLVNGEVLDESTYLDDTIITECEYTYDVPNGCVFVLGDNRQDSNDSRYWSNPYVSISSIKAKLMFVIPIHELL